MSEEGTEYNYLTPWSRFPLEKPVISEAVKICQILWNPGFHYWVRNSLLFAPPLYVINTGW